MRIVISGASGSLAQGLIETALGSTDHTLVLVDRVLPPQDRIIHDARVSYETADLLEYAAFARVVQGADALVHLAAYAQPYLASPDVIHNTNVSLSFNALQAAADAGIKRIALASSINAIGGAYSKVQKYEYFPIDEDHPPFVDEPYSLSKQISEVQAFSFSRAHPDMSISCLRFHHVVPARKHMTGAEALRDNAKDLWGWTDSLAAGRAILLALEEHCADGVKAEDLAKVHFPEAVMKKKMGDKEGFFDCSKAERLLGWKHTGGREPQSSPPHMVPAPKSGSKQPRGCVIM
ncbi:UDP-galactose 4-epimerase [Ceratobasidium sp. AG-Ba]|nr:UDP-galactose 4-epimerase [Ceratobasidium sp. AG-Ba]